VGRNQLIYIFLESKITDLTSGVDVIYLFLLKSVPKSNTSV